MQSNVYIVSQENIAVVMETREQNFSFNLPVAEDKTCDGPQNIDQELGETVILPQDRGAQLRKAARALLKDYKEDIELRSFVVLDSEGFFEYE